jgi:proteasome lid subunit RPN8/RPN11
MNNDKIKIEVPKQFYDKVNYICSQISDVEWSGVLFYDLIGSIKDIPKAKIILRDILPLDKGNKTYTEYELGEDYIDFLIEDEKRNDWKQGHIHSHNSMPTFFSGTDDEELKDNSKAHNFYLSVIVNNFNSYTAKIGIMSKAKNNVGLTFEATDEKGEQYVTHFNTYSINKEYYKTIDCDIIKPVVKDDLEKSFKQRVSSLIKKTADKSVFNLKQHFYKENKTSLQNNESWIDSFETYSSEKEPTKKSPSIEYLELNNSLLECVVLNYLGNSTTTHFETDIDFFLENINPRFFTSEYLSIINADLENNIKRFFTKDIEKDNIILIIEEMLEYLQEYTFSFPFINTVIISLEKTII